MREVWFIRHAESEANAGLRSSSPKDTAITTKGQQQAKDLSDKLNQQPDLIVVSDYIRTQQTAAPTIEKFPDTPIQKWNIHEFTYLEPSRWSGTTMAERQIPALKYWESSDPHYVDGPGAESFAMLCQRGKDTVQRLLKTRSDLVYVFSHGQFIKMLIMLSKQNDLVTVSGMKDFRDQCLSDPIKNTGIIKATISDNGLVFLETNQEDQVEEPD